LEGITADIDPVYRYLHGPYTGHVKPLRNGSGDCLTGMKKEWNVLHDAAFGCYVDDAMLDRRNTLLVAVTPVGFVLKPC
jgi:hypothetical protein